MIIRPAGETDCGKVVELVRSILEKELPAESSFRGVEDLEKFKEVYQGPSSTFLVAEEDGRIIGTLGVKAEDSRTAILRRLFVESGHRKKGVGRSLIEEALRFCRSRGFREVVIRTSAQMERAIELCRRLGFREEERWQWGSDTLVRFHLRLA